MHCGGSRQHFSSQLKLCVDSLACHTAENVKASLSLLLLLLASFSPAIHEQLRGVSGVTNFNKVVLGMFCFSGAFITYTNRGFWQEQ